MEVKKWGRTAGAVALGVATMAAVAGCGGSGGSSASSSSKTSSAASSGASASSSSSSGSGSKITVTIGYENAADAEAVAIEKGFFQKYIPNANVQMKYFSSGPKSLIAVGSGALNFMTVLGNPPAMTAMANGIPVKVVWAMERYSTGEGLVVPKSSNIKSMKDLVGKKVYLVQGSDSDLALAAAEQKYNISAGSIKTENLDPQSQVSAYSTGKINAAFVWDPFFHAMVNSTKRPGRVIVYDKDVSSIAPIFNLAVVNSKFAAAHPSIVEGFIRAENAGVQYVKAHPQESYQLMAKLNNITAADAKSQAAGLTFYSLKDQVTQSGMGTPSTKQNSLVTKGLQASANFLAKAGHLSSVPKNISQFIDPSFAQKVLQSSNQG